MPWVGLDPAHGCTQGRPPPLYAGAGDLLIHTLSEFLLAYRKTRVRVPLMGGSPRAHQRGNRRGGGWSVGRVLS